ncbi:MAG: hypothetical protein IIA98_03830, partial [Proteobacteria bacterium]|nr:hypothetical protein [Pseudomonadota bacterium]
MGADSKNQDGILSAHVRLEIDRWVAKFPEGKQRSALIGALQAAQHQNEGFLNDELMAAVVATLPEQEEEAEPDEEVLSLA